MITDKEAKKISKFLSFVLRHNPSFLGLVPDENGWVQTNHLLEKMSKREQPISLEILQYIVDTNNKKRFAFNDDKTKIRANQGHSIDVNLNLPVSTPPPLLYHGTAEKNLDGILANGLSKMERHHVHLSQDHKTAISVGGRHGKPIVFEIASGRMHELGYKFFLSENNVWLTDEVPPEFIRLT